MSFISKLFRKTEPNEAEEQAADETANDLPRSIVEDQPGPGTGDLEQADTPEPPIDTTGEATREGSANAAVPESHAPADAPSNQSIDSGSDEGETPWWEESTIPGERPTAVEPDSRPSEPAERSPVELGTRPLALEQAPDADGDGEEIGTRPLTSADVPTLAASRSQRGLAAAALRDIGRVRQVNQDSVFALLTTLPRESGDISLGLFIVADGMGGHHGGEVASRLAISTAAHYVLSELIVPALADGATEALQPLVVAAVQEANRAIWEHGQLVGSDMGTTCTLALLLGRALYVGHVGDSRAYLATPTSLQLITDDHSTVGRLIKVGQLDPAEAREHPLRSQLYRTVGQQPDVLVDFGYHQVGDATHLLMCSDGLWGMLDDEVMLDVLQHSVWPHDACQELVARANLAGGDDNITGLVVTLPSSH
jgi:PPM family protein phosphatase